MEIAVFGGMFDPPTHAHEAIIRACAARQDIDQVWLMPSGVRHDKHGIQPDEIRLQMLSVLVGAIFPDTQKVRVSDFELGLPRPTTTATTHDALTVDFPNERFWFVFGADSYHTMHTWERGEFLRRNLCMLLVERLGYDLPAQTARVKRLEVPNARAGISSTLAREAFAAGRGYEAPVHPAVCSFVLRHGLYVAVQ